MPGSSFFILKPPVLWLSGQTDARSPARFHRESGMGILDYVAEWR